MKVFKILLSVTILGAMLASLFGCSSPSDETTPEAQIASVTRGDLTLDITAAGNLALSLTEDLAIDLFFQEGTVAEVLVEEGDSVEEGQVLVRLDTDEWEEQLATLEDALATARRLVTTKERALVTAERAVTTKESALATANRSVSTVEIAYRQAEINLEAAQHNLDNIEDVREVQDDIDRYEYQLEFINMKIAESLLPGGSPADYAGWISNKALVQADLTAAQQELADILTGNSITITTSVAIEVANKQLAIETAQINLEAAAQAIADAQTDLENALVDLEDARTDVTYAQEDLEDAEQDAEDAREELEEALAASPEIKAPFDGFITQVNVAGGDEVLTGTVAVQMADPSKFEADILVSEMDILQVQLGGEATVQADALQGIVLPARVTHIAPTATIQSGVVNYAVKVELESLQEVMPDFQGMRQQMMANIAEGELPPFLQMAVDDGKMTQEEAEEFLTQGPPEGFEPPESFGPPEGFEMPEGFEFPGGTGGKVESQLPSMVMTDFQLREGLTVTVSLIIAERTDVLLVPNGAVTQEGLQSYVEVVINEDESEKRAVQTGISDWQYTEITDGLAEEEQILVPLNMSVFSSTQSQGGMRFFMPPK